MRSSIFLLVVLLFVLPLSAASKGDTKSARFYDSSCDSCALTNSCVSDPLVYTYCGQGVVYRTDPNNTDTVAMCCTGVMNSSISYQCQSYSGPSGSYQIVSGYQCYWPGVVVDLTWWVAAVVAVVVFVCVSPCVLICLCCYCCGRCRRRRESLPTALINVTPSWMLQSPSAPAAHSYYQMT
jgi:hypothetical protein